MTSTSVLPATPMLAKAVRVLALFSPSQPELGSAEMARLLRRPRSTTYRLVSAMEAVGLLDRDPATGLYALGLRLAEFGDQARQSRTLQRVALPIVRALAAETGETTTLMVRSGFMAANLEVVESLHPVVVRAAIGRPLPLHAIAGGKVLLAWRSREEQGSVLSTRLKRFTARTITQPELLQAELNRVRLRGWAEALEEWVPGVGGLAAPIRAKGGHVVAAVTLGYPAERATPRERNRLRRAVVRAAQSISSALGHAPSRGEAEED